MSTAFQKTIKILAASKTQETNHALRSAMKSSYKPIRIAASHAIVSHRNQQGLADLIRRFDELDPEQRLLLSENRSQLAPVLRNSLLSDSAEIHKNAVLALEKLSPYELLPQLLRCIEQGTPSGYIGALTWGVNLLVKRFVAEFDGTRPKNISYGHILTESIDILQKAIGTWRRHERELFINVFLKLYPRMEQCHGELLEMISNPKHPAYPVFLKKILESREPEVLQFVVQSLSHTSPPSSTLVTVARRKDRLFLKVLFESVGFKMDTFRENLSKIHHFDWIDSVTQILNDLAEGYHRFLVEFVQYSGIPEDKKHRIYDQVMKYGKSDGRVAVVEALTDLRSSLTDRMILELADDPSPDVQTAALLQLRRRGLRSATEKLMQYVDSPHPNVKKALYLELPEFRMKRLFENYTALTAEQRRAMMKVIKKIDPQMKGDILCELRVSDSQRQNRALECIAASQMVTELEDELIHFAKNTQNRELKIQTLKLLAAGTRKSSFDYLTSISRRDSSPEIRDLAQKLRQIRINIGTGF
ncbi:MAG: hypothetical protein LBQ54_14305 [Planctomycetaceae bacterium]|jgi:HEAT repeat protein|nr:hypothetical protein [Planctomycetaceae bacterium]